MVNIIITEENFVGFDGKFVVNDNIFIGPGYTLDEFRKTMDVLSDTIYPPQRDEFCFKCGYGYAMGVLKECVKEELNKI